MTPRPFAVAAGSDLLHTLEQRLRPTLVLRTGQQSSLSRGTKAKPELLRMRRDLEHLVERNAILGYSRGDGSGAQRPCASR